MTFKESAKWFAFGAFGFLVVAGVVFGVLFYNARDDGLLRICRDLNGWATYETNCSEVCWSRKTPLRVRAEGVEGLRGAVKQWNKDAGFKLFEISKDAADVLVDDQLPRADSKIHAGGTTSHKLDVSGCVTSASIHIFNVPDAARTAAVLRHELGHAAGLADDLKDFGSVMHQPPGAYVQGSDVDALRRLHSARR